MDYPERVTYAHDLVNRLTGGDVLSLSKFPLPCLEVWPEWSGYAAFGVIDCDTCFVRLGASNLDDLVRLRDWDWVIAHELGHWEDFIVNHRGDVSSWDIYRLKDSGLLPYSRTAVERYADHIAYQMTGKLRKDVILR